MRRFFLSLLVFVGCALALVGGQSPQTLPLITGVADMTYLGSFRFPDASGPPISGNSDGNSFNGGGEALSWNAARGTIFAGGTRSVSPTTMAEISVPEIRSSSTIAGYATAAYVQPHTDVLQGKQTQIGCGGPVRGSLPHAGRLILSAYCYYDAAYIQVRSHFVASQDFANLGSTAGPIEVQSPVTGGGRAGFVSGYMTRIPVEWQAALGGDALAGNCCVSIITRTSWGPSVSVVNLSDFGARDPIPATWVLGYPTGNPLDGGAGCDATSTLFNCATQVMAAVFVPGTRSLLFFGTHGTGPHCYGTGNTDPALHGTQVPNEPGNHYCYDPAGGSKGPHTYPYHHYVWAYDANDLVAVKNGQRQPWELRPYATWGFDVPFQSLDRGVHGVTYDAATRRLFVATNTANSADGYKPLMHVFRLGQGGTTPLPTDTDGDGVPDSSDQCPTVSGPAPSGCPATPPPPPSGDTIAPTLSVTNLAEGASVPLGSFEILATATDNVGVVGVRFEVDGVLLEDDTVAPFDGFWSTVTDGPHVIRVTARDAAGNTTVVIRNVFGGTATPPPPTDTDGDTVPDSTDQCPTVAGPAPSGCPVTPPPPPPPPSDPCMANPGVLTVSSWPLIAEGARSLRYTYDVSGVTTTSAGGRLVVEFNATRAFRVTLTDARGCVAVVSR